MTVYLLRHGRTAWNDARRYLGKTDVPLCPEGAEELGRADFAPELVYTSPLLRARQTVLILFPTALLETVDALAEMDFGEFEGRSAEEMADDPVYRAWVEGGCAGRCPNGEGRADFCMRVCRAFEALVERAAGEGRQELVIVAHGGTLRAVMERFSLPAFGYFDLSAPFGGGYALSYDAALWTRERKLRLLKAVRFLRGDGAC